MLDLTLPFSRTLGGGALVLLVLLGAGCASQVTIPAWQRGVTRYVREQGHRDPSVLRDMTLADSRPGFALIGHHDPAQSTDVNGLLLGHERVGGRMWFVYLVGLVEKQRVTDIRLAAVSIDNGRATWRRGRRSKPSLRAYREEGVKQARQRFPDRRTPPPRYLGFPRPDDVFKLTQTNELIATHEASGARWEVTLPQK